MVLSYSCELAADFRNCQRHSVDYLGLAHELKKALANYTESGGKGQTAVDQDEAAAEMLKRYEICAIYFMASIGRVGLVELRRRS